MGDQEWQQITGHTIVLSPRDSDTVRTMHDQETREVAIRYPADMPGVGTAAHAAKYPEYRPLDPIQRWGPILGAIATAVEQHTDPGPVRTAAEAALHAAWHAEQRRVGTEVHAAHRRLTDGGHRGHGHDAATVNALLTGLSPTAVDHLVALLTQRAATMEDRHRDEVASLRRQMQEQYAANARARAWLAETELAKSEGRKTIPIGDMDTLPRKTEHDAQTAYAYANKRGPQARG